MPSVDESPARSKTANENRITVAVICVLLIASTIASYHTVLSCGFVSFDDPEYVTRNPHVLSGLSLAGWNYAWTSRDCSNWHPVTWLSLELDGTFWRRNPVGYHATNLALHVVNTLLLFFALKRMTNSVYGSGFVAGFFALHPLHVESVAWIAERKDVLSTFFLLLTIHAYIGYAARPSVVRYLIVFILFTLGLLAKPMLVTLPILLLLLDWWPLNRIQFPLTAPGSRIFDKSIRRVIIEKLPMLCLSFVDGLMTISAQRDAAKVLTHLKFSSRLGNSIDAFVWYLHKTFLPSNLIVFYPHPQHRMPAATVAFDATLLLGISVAVIWFGRRKPHLIVGWLWFLISLLPVIGLFQVGGQAYADRYTYIPHIGLFVMIVWELQSGILKSGIARRGSFVVGLAALAVCGVLTHAQLRYWKDSESLWGHAIEIIPDNGVAHAHMSDVKFEAGDYEACIRHIERGLQLTHSGYVANAYCNWGRCLLALNRRSDAEQKFREALRNDRNHEGSLSELSKLLAQQGNTAEAEQIAIRQLEALSIRANKEPNNAGIQLSLGVFKARRGNYAGALGHFARAVELAPDSAAAHHNLGLAMIQGNRLKEAKPHFQKAIELNPQLGMAHFGLAELLEREKDFAGAKEHYAIALQINPQDVQAQERLQRLSNP